MSSRPVATRVIEPSARTRRLGLAVVVAGNLVPIVGVARWEWNLWTLLALYWLEALGTLLLAAVEALFARQGSPDAPGIAPLYDLREKRGGVTLREGWPPVYPRNVPFAVSMVGAWSVTVLPISLLAWVALSPAFSPGLLVGALAVLVAHAFDFRFDYIANERYDDVSARELLRAPAQHVAVVILLAPFAAGDVASGAALLVGVVLAKTAAAGYRYHVDHGGTPLVELFDWLSVARMREPPPAVSLPDAPVDGRVRTDTRAVVLGSAVPLAVTLAGRGGVLLAALFVLGVATGSILLLGLATAALSAVTVVVVLARYLRYGTLEYQRRGDTIVAYDRLLADPQWTAPAYPAHLDVANAIPDRLLGTGTLILSTSLTDADDTVRLGPVADLDDAVETLGLPVTDTDRPSADYTVVAAAAVSVVAFLLLPLGLLATAGPGDGGAVGASLVLVVLFAPLVGALAWAALARL